MLARPLLEYEQCRRHECGIRQGQQRALSRRRPLEKPDYQERLKSQALRGFIAQRPVD
jgi:hypothetical protein